MTMRDPTWYLCISAVLFLTSLSGIILGRPTEPLVQHHATDQGDGNTCSNTYHRCRIPVPWADWCFDVLPSSVSCLVVVTLDKWALQICATNQSNWNKDDHGYEIQHQHRAKYAYHCLLHAAQRR